MQATMPTPNVPIEPNEAELFGRAVIAYVHSTLRLGRARLVHSEMKLLVPLAVMTSGIQPRQIISELPLGAEKICAELATVTREEYEAHAYVVEVSFLVYATALFDTFLQDVLEFLLLRHPTILSDVTVDIATIASAP